MKQTIKKATRSLKLLLSTAIFFAMILISSLVSCEQYELPEAGSIADLTPPSAGFISALDGSYLKFKFTNVSVSATDYAWSFGDGNTSTEMSPTHTYAGEGSYTVTLTAKDKLGVTSTATEVVEVVKPPVPVIKLPEVLEPGFDKGNDSRYAWRTSDFQRAGIDGVIQISTTKHEGTNSAKLPNDDSRFGYQVLDGFSQNATYVLTYWYRMKNGKAGTGLLNVSMVKPLTAWNLSTLPGDTIATVVHSEDVNNIDTWAQGTLEFNTGNHTKLCILFYNNVEEINVDTFELKVKN